MNEMPWWAGIISAVIGAAAVIWGVVATRRSHKEERQDSQAVRIIEGFAELVKALETRVDSCQEEIQRSEDALKRCRSEVDKMRRVLLTFQHGGVIPNDE